MTSIKIIASGASVSAKLDGKITSGMIGIPVNIEYDDQWAGMNKTAFFRVGNFVRKRDSVGVFTTVPWEVLRKDGNVLEIGLEGRDSKGEIVMPTVWATVGTIKQGAQGEIPAAPNLNSGGNKPTGETDIDDSEISPDKTWSSEKISEEISGCVKSVNGIPPDENGNVQVETGSGSAEVPVFNLTSMGLPEVPTDGTLVGTSFNTDELLSAVQKDSVFVTVDVMGMSHDVLMNGVIREDGTTQLCGTMCVVHYDGRSEPYAASIVISDGYLSASVTPLATDNGSAEGAVLYTEQQLTEEEKAQARENIGAVSNAELQSAVDTEAANRNTAIATEKEALQSEIAVERARITNLASLDEGSTTGDAELMDIRVDKNGNTYGNAGEAVRTQIGSVQDGMTSYSLKDCFETGTLYVYDGKIYYQNPETNVRTKQNTFLLLHSGDIIHHTESVKVRVIKKVGSICTEIYNFTNTSGLTLDESAEYAITIGTSEPLDIETAMRNFEIIKGHKYLVNKISANEEGIAVLKSGIVDSVVPFASVIGEMCDTSGTDVTDTITINYGKNTFAENGVMYITTEARRASTRPFLVENPLGLKIKPVDGVLFCIYKIEGTTIVQGKTPGEALLGSYDETREYILPYDPVNAYAIGCKNADNSNVTDGQALFIAETVEEYGVKEPEVREETLPTVFENNHPRPLLGVMTYNVGIWYNGSGVLVPSDKYATFEELQKSIIDRYAPDVLCLQEYNSNFTSENTAEDVLLSERYLYKDARQPTVVYDGKAICSNLILSDAENVAYSSDDGGARNYHKAYITVNGRKVCVVSTHWGITDNSRALQAQELLSFANTEEYIIICLDSNVNHADTASADYSNTVMLFVDAGYKLCNDGTHITYPANSTAIDNIIVSSNINIKSVIMDTQKEGLEDGADHYPLMAYLEIF